MTRTGKHSALVCALHRPEQLRRRITAGPARHPRGPVPHVRRRKPRPTPLGPTAGYGQADRCRDHSECFACSSTIPSSSSVPCSRRSRSASCCWSPPSSRPIVEGRLSRRPARSGLAEGVGLLSAPDRRPALLKLRAAKPEYQPGGDRFRVLTDPVGHPFCLVPRRLRPPDHSQAITCDSRPPCTAFRRRHPGS